LGLFCGILNQTHVANFYIAFGELFWFSGKCLFALSESAKTCHPKREVGIQFTSSVNGSVLRELYTCRSATMGAQESNMTESDNNNSRMCCISELLNESCYDKTDRSYGLGDTASRFEKWQERMKHQDRVPLQRTDASFVGADSVNHYLVSLCSLCPIVIRCE